MHGMADAVLKLTAECRLPLPGATARRVWTADDGRRLGERIVSNTLQKSQDVAAGDAGVSDILFETRISLRAIVLNFYRTKAFHQTFEWFEDAAKVASDRDVVRRWRDFRVGAVVKPKQQMQALSE